MDEIAVILTYAPQARRAGLGALLSLDRTLGGILRSTREPLVGQMRLTWWREALERLDGAPAPAEPVLAALSAEVLPRGVSGATLAGMVDGWDVLLGEPLGDDVLMEHASARGGGLFQLGAQLLDADFAQVTSAGEGWALADLARNLSDGALAGRARAMASERLEAALRCRWPRRVRALGALAHLARMAVARPDRPAGHPARVARIGWHRVSGR